MIRGPPSTATLGRIVSATSEHTTPGAPFRRVYSVEMPTGRGIAARIHAASLCLVSSLRPISGLLAVHSLTRGVMKNHTAWLPVTGSSREHQVRVRFFFRFLRTGFPELARC